ncbi:MAG: hypothetical protein HQL56_19610 [Magnetococcales bacterium]|nr:hypothetical protein [Magnetococcales bacterium]
MVAQAAHNRNLPPQTIWSDLKRQTGFYRIDDMTHAAYRKALDHLVTQAK